MSRHRNVRYARLAGNFVSVKAGERRGKVSAEYQEQARPTQAIPAAASRTQGVLGHPEATMTALSPGPAGQPEPVPPGYVLPGVDLQKWNPETRSHDRYVIDRVTAQSHSLTLRDAQGETQVVRISSLDSSWSAVPAGKIPVAEGERLRVTVSDSASPAGDRLQVASVSEDAMAVVGAGRADASPPVGYSPFTAPKLESGWVENARAFRQ